MRHKCKVYKYKDKWYVECLYDEGHFNHTIQITNSWDGAICAALWHLERVKN